MDFEEYQKKAARTALYPDAGKNFVYPTMGLVGEAGEIANKAKKIIRDHDSEIKEQHIEDMKGELGDVLWYVAQVAAEFGLNLNDIAEANIEKLASRKERGKIGGSGDKR